MPTEVPIDKSIRARATDAPPAPSSQTKPRPAGPRAPTNKAAAITSVARPGARYQFLTSCGEFNIDQVASYEQIHGHGGLGKPNEDGDHTGADVADLIKRGVLEQVPDDTELTDPEREPALIEVRNKIKAAKREAAAKSAAE